MIAVIIFMKNMDKTANYKYTLMVVRPRPACCRPCCLLASATEINGSRIWLAHSGSFSFQPREIAKIAIVLFLAGYLAQNREMLSVFTRQVSGRSASPTSRTLAAAPCSCGCPGHGHRRLREGSWVQRASCCSSCSSLCSTPPRRQEVLPGRRACGTGRRRCGRPTCSSCSGTCRPASAPGSTPSPTPLDTGYQLVQSHLLHRRRRPVRRRHRAAAWPT